MASTMALRITSCVQGIVAPIIVPGQRIMYRMLEIVSSIAFYSLLVFLPTIQAARSMGSYLTARPIRMEGISLRWVRLQRVLSEMDRAFAASRAVSSSFGQETSFMGSSRMCGFHHLLVTLQGRKHTNHWFSFQNHR